MKMVRVESEVFVGVGRFIVNLPALIDTSLSRQLKYKLNDHLSLFKGSKRRPEPFVPTNFSFKRPVSFV